MKSESEQRFINFSAIAALILIVVLLAGTAIAYATGLPSKKANAQNRMLEARNVNNETLYSLGTIRAQSSDDTTVVATVTLVSYADSIELKDEFTQNEARVKDSLVSFFTLKNSTELDTAYEQRIKKEILDRVNALFILGKFDAVYLSDFALIK